MRLITVVWMFLLISLGACATTGEDIEVGVETAVPLTTTPTPITRTTTPTPTPSRSPESFTTTEARIHKLVFLPPHIIALDVVVYCNNVLDYQTTLDDVDGDRVSITVTAVLDAACEQTNSGFVERESVRFDPLALAPDVTEFQVQVNGQSTETFTLLTGEPALAESSRIAFSNGCPLAAPEDGGYLAGFGLFCLQLPPVELENVYADYLRFRADIVQDEEPRLQLTIESSAYLDNVTFDEFLADFLPSDANFVGEMVLDGQTAVIYETDISSGATGAVRYLFLNQRGIIIWVKLESLTTDQADLLEETWTAAFANFNFNTPLED